MIAPLRAAARVSPGRRPPDTSHSHLAAELPLLAVLRLSVSDPKQKYMTDRYQREAYTDPYKNP